MDPGKVRRLSLSEQELVKAEKDHGEDLIRYTSLCRNICNLEISFVVKFVLGCKMETKS